MTYCCIIFAYQIYQRLHVISCDYDISYINIFYTYTTIYYIQHKQNMNDYIYIYICSYNYCSDIHMVSWGLEQRKELEFFTPCLKRHLWTDFVNSSWQISFAMAFKQ